MPTLVNKDEICQITCLLFLPAPETTTTRCIDKTSAVSQTTYLQFNRSCSAVNDQDLNCFAFSDEDYSGSGEASLSIQETYGTDLQVGQALLCHVSKRETHAHAHAHVLTTGLSPSAFNLPITGNSQVNNSDFNSSSVYLHLRHSLLGQKKRVFSFKSVTQIRKKYNDDDDDDEKILCCGKTNIFSVQFNFKLLSDTKVEHFTDTSIL